MRRVFPPNLSDLAVGEDVLNKICLCLWVFSLSDLWRLHLVINLVMSDMQHVDLHSQTARTHTHACIIIYIYIDMYIYVPTYIYIYLYLYVSIYYRLQVIEAL